MASETVKIKTYEDTEEGKKANVLLEKALKAYECDRKYLHKNQDGTEEYKFYPKGRQDQVFKYLNPDFDSKNKIKYPKYLIPVCPVITFCTLGGQKRHYFDEMENMKGNVFYHFGKFLDFDELKLTQEQCDGISRKKPKPVQ